MSRKESNEDSIRARTLKARAMPTAPKVRVVGGKGSDAGLVRHELYKVAWERYNEAMSAGFYLEAITLVDSVITDRIEAYTQYLMHYEEKHQQVTSLANAMAAMDIAREERQIPTDAEYKNMRAEVSLFYEGRNKAVHNFAILSNADAEMTADDRLKEAQETARKGRDVFNLVKSYTRKQMYGAKHGD
jgi:uncharacterized protein (DUF342 family)